MAQFTAPTTPDSIRVVEEKLRYPRFVYHACKPKFKLILFYKSTKYYGILDSLHYPLLQNLI
jgi:hypothetical protein